MTDQPARNFTFLFTDIVGSTRLWEQHPKEIRNDIVRHNEILQAIVQKHGGSVFKTVGDACHAVFSLTTSAVMCAVEIQEALAKEKWEVPEGVWVRIAIHTGEAEESNGDYLGPALNLAARLRDSALGGNVILSSAAVQAIRDPLSGGLILHDLGETRLRGFSTPTRLYRLEMAGLPTLPLVRHQIQIASVVVTCEPFRWPRNAWEILELHITGRTGPLHKDEVRVRTSKDRRVYDDLRGRSPVAV